MLVHESLLFFFFFIQRTCREKKKDVLIRKKPAVGIYIYYAYKKCCKKKKKQKKEGGEEKVTNTSSPFFFLLTACLSWVAVSVPGSSRHQGSRHGPPSRAESAVSYTGRTNTQCSSPLQSSAAVVRAAVTPRCCNACVPCSSLGKGKKKRKKMKTKPPVNKSPM